MCEMKNSDSRLPECEKCLYMLNCPVHYDCGNAACILLFNHGLKRIQQSIDAPKDKQ